MSVHICPHHMPSRLNKSTCDASGMSLSRIFTFSRWRVVDVDYVNSLAETDPAFARFSVEVQVEEDDSCGRAVGELEENFKVRSRISRCDNVAGADLLFRTSTVGIFGHTREPSLSGSQTYVLRGASTTKKGME